MSLRATMRWQTELEATGSRGAWRVRAFASERDADAVSQLDTSYTSAQACAVHRSGDVVALAPTAASAPYLNRERRRRIDLDLVHGPSGGLRILVEASRPMDHMEVHDGL